MASDDWLFGLVAQWQVAAFLPHAITREHILALLDGILKAPERSDHPIARLLMRGFLLETAAALRLASVRVSPECRPNLLYICQVMNECAVVDDQLRRRIQEVVSKLQRPSFQGDSELAQRAHTWIDRQGGSRVTVAMVARAVGVNASRLNRAFRRVYGTNIAAYRREQTTLAAMAAVTIAQPLKRVASHLHCGEATIRRLLRKTTQQTPRQLRGKFARILVACDASEKPHCCRR